MTTREMGEIAAEVVGVILLGMGLFTFIMSIHLMVAF
jgi:hypothetical protein